MQSRYQVRRAVITTVAIILLFSAVAPLFAGADIDVAYISRTPRYWKYNVEFQNHYDPLDWWGNGRFYLSPEEAAKQRWPNAGESVLFTAVIKNPGDAPTGTFNYKWYLDGVEVKSGSLPSIGPGWQATTSYTWTWDSEWNDHNIKFVADPGNQISENVEANNVREDRTNALSFRIHVWQSAYDWFQENGCSANIGSFDDYIQMQLGHMNRMFSEAVWPLTPNGILERVRLDEIVIEPDDTVDPDPNACHAPPNLEWDCRWGFTLNEYPRIWQENPDFLTQPYTWILHEWGHQLGQVDVYQLGYGKETNKVLPLGHMPTRSYCMMTANEDIYSDLTSYSLTVNLHKRRGYFGEYLYDVPRTCKVRVLDAYYQPISGAALEFYQKNQNEIVSPPTFVGVTDNEGYFTLPNRTCYGEMTTGTGHVLHDNPWSLIHPSAINGNFFCKITKNGQTDYQFVEIVPFNMAFWAGLTTEYAYDLQTTIIPGGRPTINDLLGVKTVSSDLAYAVGCGGTILRWNGYYWSTMSSPTSYNLHAVDVHKESGLACAVGDNGAVLIKTPEGNWEIKNIGTTYRLLTCAVVSPNIIIVGGDNGRLYRSINGGASWTNMSSGYSNIACMAFWDSSRGIMIRDSTPYYTTNGGASWTNSYYGFYAGATDCCVASSSEAWACTAYPPAVYKSTNGGISWTRTAYFGYTEDMYGIAMGPGGDGWCSGGVVEDLGIIGIKRFWHDKWVHDCVTTSGSMDYIYDISCLNGDDAWAVGKGGLILHLVNNNLASFKKGNIEAIMTQPDGTPVLVTNTATTGNFEGCVYVENLDRNNGLKVLTSESIAPGTLATVTGTLDTIGLERVVRYGNVVGLGDYDLRPLGMTTRSITGSASDPGVSSIPLLVRICGIVTARDDPGYGTEVSITVDDGSGRMDQYGNKGVRVILADGTPPEVGTMVSVTGVSTFMTVSETTYPLIKTRFAEDIVCY